MRVLIALLLLFPSFGWAEPRWPRLSSPVVDQAGLLSSQEKREMETWLHRYRQQGKAQVQVVIIDTLEDWTIEQYSIKLVEQWKLGSAQKDDGVLLLIAVKDKKMRIEVGQGLEGALTDLQSKRILDDRVRPLFRSRQFAAGVAAGIAEIIAAVDPEYAAASSENHQWEDGKASKWGNGLYLLLVFLMVIMSFIGRVSRFGQRGYRGAWGGPGLGGGWGGGRSGGWGGGGGGFSGGGASSNW